MADIYQGTWSETDASNNSSSGEGWPENMPPSQVNNAGRMMMGATKRFYDRINFVKTTVGTSNSQHLLYDVADSSYSHGMRVAFKAGYSNTDSMTLNLNSLGPKIVYTQAGASLTASLILSGQFYEVHYDSGLGGFRLVTNTATGAGSGTVTSVSVSSPSDGGVSFTGTVTNSGSIAAQLADDLKAVEGLSLTGFAVRTGTNAWANRSLSAGSGIAITNPAGVAGDPAVALSITTLTEDTAPDASADFVITYDDSAAANKKARINNVQVIGLVSKSSAYELTLADANKIILHPDGDGAARTFTIPSNASVAFPIGTTITFVNQQSAGAVAIAITSDTMRLAGAGTTGTRSLVQNGVATAIKIASTAWIINGTGLS